MRESVPGWARFFLKLHGGATTAVSGGPTVRASSVINFHKIITLFLILGMMFAYGNFSTGAWVYLALHGVYGYCWLIKDLGFRDQSLEGRMGILSALALYIILLAWYWLIPWLFISRHVEPGNFDIFIAIAVHTLGVVTMIAADGQRHFVLKYRKGLITSGMFRYTRNPNYLGEIMLYSAYCYLADHWLAWAILGYAVITFFLPRMYAKDASISRHDGWEDYKARSALLIPWRLINGSALVERFKEAQPETS